MFASPAQFNQHASTAIQSQLNAYATLANSIIEQAAKLSALHLGLCKSLVEESSGAAKQIAFTANTQNLSSIVSAQVQPGLEKLTAYSQQLASIASQAQTEYSKLLEAQIAAGNQQIHSLLEGFSKAVPASPQAALTLVKSAISNAGAGNQMLPKFIKQNIETVEAKTVTAVAPTAPTGEKTNSRSKK